MNIRQMEIFVNVVKYKNFSNAAKKMYLSQPAISSSIDLLEKELGKKLLIQQGRTMKLTTSGEVFYDGALSILGLTEQTVQKVKDCTSLSGTIRIASSYIPGAFYIPEIIGKFRGLYPNVIFDFSIISSKDVVKEVLNSQFDLGITGTLVNNKQVNQYCVLRDKICIAAPPIKPFLDLPKVLNAEHLRSIPLVVNALNTPTQTLAEMIFLEKGIDLSELNVVCETNDSKVAAEAVLFNTGATVASSFFIERYPSLLLFEIEGIDICRNFYATYPNNNVLTPRLLEFLNHLPPIEPKSSNIMGELKMI